MGIRHELVALARRMAAALSLPPVADAFIADPDPALKQNTEFGLLALADGSAGLYYAWLGASQADMPGRFSPAALRGLPALEAAELVLGDDDGLRSLGVAALNALTEHLYRRAGFAPPPATDSFGGLTLEAGDRLGMIGYFPPLAARARAEGVPTYVVERKAHLLGRDGSVEVALDPRPLSVCNKVICTGATLLNDSLDEMLGYCAKDAEVALVGPTVGFFPDPLFARGVRLVAGTRLLDSTTAEACLARNEKFGDCAQRTIIRREDYPGFDVLLARAVAR
ncbi:MAG: DUF364 domain-containing protein [Gammaproteobacteria bacterium]